MTKAKKGVKRAVKNRAKRKTGKKSGKGSPKRAQPPEWAPGEEPPFDPDRYDDHRGDYMIPNQPIYEMLRGSAPLPLAGARHGRTLLLRDEGA